MVTLLKHDDAEFWEEVGYDVEKLCLCWGRRVFLQQPRRAQAVLCRDVRDLLVQVSCLLVFIELCSRVWLQPNHRSGFYLFLNMDETWIDSFDY